MRQEVRQVLKRFAALATLLAAATPAYASFLSGDALDGFANLLAWFVIIVMPLAGIAIFLLIHILPEKIAEKRHHPQKDVIKVLCILSLFFGGMLWPFAWIWAYTRPTMHRAIFGTERHEDYYFEMAEKARVGVLTAEEIDQLRHELDTMKSKDALTPALQRVVEDLATLAAAPRAATTPAPATSGGKA